MSGFLRFRNRDNPCPLCTGSRKDDDCRQSIQTEFVHCRATDPFNPPPGWRFVKHDALGAPMFAKEDGFCQTTRTRVVGAAPARAAGDGKKRTDDRGALAFERTGLDRRPLSLQTAMAFAHAMQLPLVSFVGLWEIEDRQGRPALIYDERDGEGNVIARRIRTQEGKKLAVRTSGLVYADAWQAQPGPVMVCEGKSDQMVGDYLGLALIGRPNNTGGAAHLAQLLRIGIPADRAIVILGENDKKPDGSWEGQRGAYEVASRLAAELRRTIYIAFPPAGYKDLREWYLQQWLEYTASINLSHIEHDEDWYAVPGQVRANLARQLIDHVESGWIAINPTGGMEFQPAPAAGPATGAVSWPAAGGGHACGGDGCTMDHARYTPPADRAPTWARDPSVDGNHGTEHVVFRRCPNACKSFMVNQRSSLGGMFRFSCGKITCEVCGPRCRERWQETIRTRLLEHQHAVGDPVYRFECREADWPRIHRAINRRHGNYIRLDPVSSGDFIVVASVRPARGVEFRIDSPADVIAELCTLLDRSPLMGKVWASSRGWCLLSDDPVNGTGWQRLGKYTASDQDEDEMLASFHLAARSTQPRGRWAPYWAKIFRMPTGFDYEHFYACLCAGEFLPQDVEVFLANHRDDQGNRPGGVFRVVIPGVDLAGIGADIQL